MSTTPVSLGARLERDRLQDRAARLDRVVTVLRARTYDYGEGEAPPALKHSLADFQRELSAVRAQLTRDAG